MPAYLIAEVEVTDAQRYDAYRKLAPPAIAKYGGRYLARGGETVTLEGSWQPKRLLVVEFPTLARAQEFYRSPEYQAAKEARAGGATMKILAVEGL